MFIQDPDLDFLPTPDFGSNGQKGTGSQIQWSKSTGSRISDPDPQH
jgi:hypothetical protein